VVRSKSQESNVLLKKPLKLRNEKSVNETPELIQANTDLYSLCGSLVERYKRDDLSFHFHYFSRLGRSRTGRNFCAMIARSQSALDRMTLGTTPLGMGSMDSKSGEKYPSMLVDVAEIVQNPQAGAFPLIPSVVRLQSLDFCNSVCGHAEKPIPQKFLCENFGSFADGEKVTILGFIVRGEYEFPHQIIERRSQVLESIPNNERYMVRNGNPSVKSTNNAARLRLFLSHHFARFVLEVQNTFRFKRLEVLCGPEDFLPDKVKRSYAHNSTTLGFRTFP